MKKAKFAAITMGMAASCLFGCYAVADAATITLDESAAGTPENPQPISAYNARKAVIETSVITRQTSKNRTAAEKEKNDKKLNASPAVFEKKVPVSLPDEAETANTIETIEETLPAAAEQPAPETTETPAETTAPVRRIFVKSTLATVKPYQETTETSTTTVEIETAAPETEAATEAETTASETEAATETETTTPETEAESSTETTTVQSEASEEETTPAVTESEETKATTAETVYTVADITTAAHKTTTAQTTTRETTTSVPKPVFSSPAAATTTRPETTTTETASSTTESTTTSATTTTTTTSTTTATEPILTTVSETTTEAVLNHAEIVDVAEVYLDNILDADYQEIETAPAVLETTAPETQTTPETTATQAAVSASSSITDREYVLLCNCVAHEAGSDVITIENKAKVVEVVMNRVASSKFPDTIYGVITQKYQFSGSSSYADLTSYSRKVTDNVKAAVDLYFSDPSAFSHGYLYFYGDGSQNHFRTS